MVLFLSLAITFFLLAAGQQNQRALKVCAASKSKLSQQSYLAVGFAGMSRIVHAGQHML